MLKVKEIIALLFFGIFFFGCYEDLPLRSDPTNIFSGQLTNVYRYKPGQNGIYIIASIANNFDETISGKVIFNGTLQIEWVIPIDRVGNITTSRTVKLTTLNMDIIHAKNYNTAKNELTFEPHDTIKIGYLWDFKFDDGTDARTVQAFWEGQKNIGCGNYVGLNETPRMVYPSHEFKVNCKLQVFDKLSFMYFPEVNINTCTINFYPDKPCSGMAAPKFDESPCSLR